MPRKADIADALKDKPFFRGRNRDNEREAGAAFARLAEMGPARNATLFAGRYQGVTPWERHPNGDELVHVLDGATTIFLLTDDGEEPHPLSAGQLIIVPAGIWHRFETPDGVTILTATPLPTDHSSADDPRV